MTVEQALAILHTALQPKCLNDVQELVFLCTWQGQTYEEIASASGYDADYIKHVGSQLWLSLSEVFGEKVTKKNFRSILRQQRSREDTETRKHKDLETTKLTTSTVTPCQDWGEAIDVSFFYGRIEELGILEQWVVTDRCRLVTLLGMGGIGKTALAVRLAEQVQGEFEFLIWRSLRNAPLVENILDQFIQFLCHQQEACLPKNLDDKIARLLHCLCAYRCLLVLDNAESVLQSGNCTGRYREGYEGYGQLLRCVAETHHQSCLLLTTREQPKGLAAKEGRVLPVRSLKLTGLRETEAKQIFQAKGDFSGSKAEWNTLITHYGGNPLALKIVASEIQYFLDGRISWVVELLTQGALIFNDVQDLLERQFQRLSDLEKEIMYWLVTNREPISLQELQEDFVPKVSLSKLIENLSSLERRSLIEKVTSVLVESSTTDAELTRTTGFTQQPVVMEYMTEKLIEQVCVIAAEEVEVLMSYALLKAQAKDYVRDTQIRIVLEPVAKQLLSSFMSKKNLEYYRFDRGAESYIDSTGVTR